VKIGPPYSDGGQAPLDAAVDLSRGTLSSTASSSRSWRSTIGSRMLSAVDGEPSLTAVVPGSIVQLGPIDISAFRVLSARFTKLGLGTWHIGPYFVATAARLLQPRNGRTGIADYTRRQLDERWSSHVKRSVEIAAAHSGDDGRAFRAEGLAVHVHEQDTALRLLGAGIYIWKMGCGARRLVRAAASDFAGAVPASRHESGTMAARRSPAAVSATTFRLYVPRTRRC